MKMYCFLCPLVLFMALGWIPGVLAADGNIELATDLHSRIARPYDVEIRATEGGVVVSGKLRKVLANPVRRLSGRVQVELLDHNGRVIGVRYAKPERLTMMRYSHFERFRVTIEPLPESTREIRIGYH